MKPILAFLTAILCSLNAFGQGAQYRPTPFANGFVQTVTSTGTAQTYLGIASATNNALLTGTNNFTGPNTFAPARFFPANSIGMRLLWSSPTNIYVASVVTNATLNWTNSGDFSRLTHFASGTLPPLLGSNSAIVCYGNFNRTNANASSATLAFFLGQNTNFVGGTPTFANTAGVGGANGLSLFNAANSHTLQLQGLNFTTPAILAPIAAADTSTNFQFYLGLMTATNHTNLQAYGFRIYELYAP